MRAGVPEITENMAFADSFPAVGDGLCHVWRAADYPSLDPQVDRQSTSVVLAQSARLRFQWLSGARDIGQRIGRFRSLVRILEAIQYHETLDVVISAQRSVHRTGPLNQLYLFFFDLATNRKSLATCKMKGLPTEQILLAPISPHGV